jgi:hypothetical protein
MIVRKTVEAGIEGITQEYKDLYKIEVKGGYVTINDPYTIHISINSIKKVQESEIEYEIQTTGASINLSKTEKSIAALIRM